MPVVITFNQKNITATFCRLSLATGSMEGTPVCKTGAYVLSGSIPPLGTKTVRGASAPMFTRAKAL